MVDATAQSVGVEQATDGARPGEITTRAESGSVLFPELVRAHYAWEKAGCADGSEADRYRDVLQAFQGVIFGKAEQTIAASLSPPTAAERRRRADEDDED
jgi:hypothetical protein